VASNQSKESTVQNKTKWSSMKNKQKVEWQAIVYHQQLGCISCDFPRQIIFINALQMPVA
jgi:hypothetical protein